MEHFKRSTSRDFKINGATLEAVLRESSDDEEEDEEEEGEEEAEDVNNKELDEVGEVYSSKIWTRRSPIHF